MRAVTRGIVLSGLLGWGTVPGWAQEPRPAFDLDEFYGFGISEHALDAATEVVGWRLSESWYFGRRDEKGAEDGLSLVWQGERQQVSVSLEEIRFVRRF